MRSFSFLSYFCCWPFKKSNPAPHISLDDDNTIFLGPTMSTSNYVTCEV